jgi:biopolymer transport protein ExbD
MRRHHKDLPLITQINLTSLLDVAFVLLIAFMIVAPALQYGFDLDLPTVKDGAPQIEQSQQHLFTIVVPKAENGIQEYFMNDTPSALRDIEERLKLQKKQGGKLAVEIQADKDVPYDTFVQVIAAIRRAGIEAVGLPVDAASVARPAATGTPAPTPRP